jgi:outer membrane immunogenic protein
VATTTGAIRKRINPEAENKSTVGLVQEARMKRMLIAGALAFAAVGQALAADLPPPSEPMAPPPRAPATYVPTIAPGYNWGGVYFGINGGGGVGSSNWSDAGNLVGSTGDFNTDGFLIGGTVGANFQASQIVFGIEADLDFSTFQGTSTSGFCTMSNGTFFGNTCNTRNNWLSTVRGRLGYAADRFLVYVTGGGAFGNVEAGLSGGGIGTTDYQNNTEIGWTAGAGVEVAFAQNWTGRIEYLYVDLSNGTCNVGGSCGFEPPGVFPFITPNDSVRFSANIIRLGIDYKFGGF